MNKVILIGNLTRDVDIRQSQNGASNIATFTLAVNRRIKRYGEQEADFIQIVAFGKLADICSQYISKGSKVAVFGRIQIRTYDDNDGKRRYVTEIIADEVEFLDPPNNSSQ